MNRFVRSLIRGSMFGAILGAYIYFRNRERERAYRSGGASTLRVDSRRVESTAGSGRFRGGRASTETQALRRVVVRRTR